MTPTREGHRNFFREDLRAVRTLAVSAVIGGLLWTVALALSLGVKLP